MDVHIVKAVLKVTSSLRKALLVMVAKSRLSGTPTRGEISLGASPSKMATRIDSPSTTYTPLELLQVISLQRFAASGAGKVKSVTHQLVYTTLLRPESFYT